METVKRSTFKLLFYLKKNEPKKNGNVPIMGRITIDGTPKTFAAKLEINPDNWDLKHGRVLGKSAPALSTNLKLDNIRVRVNKIYDDMLKDEGFATSQKVKLSFLGVGVMDDAILKVFKDQNEEFERMVSKGKRSQNTYNKYKTVYRHLCEFIKERYHREDMAFRELTADFIREFDFFLRIDKECTHNTVWVYTMPVIALADLAIKKGLIRQNPFEDYEISMQETDRSYLLKEDVEKLMLLKPSKSKYELVKDLFIFSCFTGLSYIDIQKLKWSNIQSFFDGHQWIISRRRKSDVASNVRLLEIPKRIIEKYRGITRDDYVFPVPSNATCNSHMKKLIEETEIITEHKVTFHTARHTFATMFLTEGLPLESLSKMMGHKNISTTQIYAKITSQKISKDMDIVADKFAGMETAFIEMEEEAPV
ncbi:site-specific integrase [Elizabethkingia meningoseptica]|uniref:site-specific integrase n=1 Tax=Elizabethkingia meningoseptica TaxID=238 RepID=UPI0023B05623|nr:site-specific integrase [Elizabethkingia meningoseptica]MDE5437622.1 site-specific integrase [Elizabethkingia meningoseptica]MDE5467972.1 site-specific integrase [Elizabethkingia meningoseptica]MDE5474891.1 site-specific integrase [Elizabethkingia meningoseptica]MDE5478324.1 site-specific integrase [Elizabethkingia meningoseptica]MDE5486723.1 site-specific integrase [Elizabethkingia meningoseptica]